MFRKKRKLVNPNFKKRRRLKPNKRLSKYRLSNQSLQKKPSLSTKKKKTITKLLIVFILISAMYMAFFSNYFTITEVKNLDKEIGNEVMAGQIESSISSALGKNLLFIDTEELKEKILDTFPELEELEVKKNYPKRLEITFTEYALVANIINESSKVKKSYIVNSIGYAIKEDFENPTLPYIRIISDEPANTEKPVIEASKLRYILETIIYFEEKFGMKILETEYKPTPREIHLLTEKNFYIWIDIQNPADQQLKKLKKALVKLDIYNENLEYIDLRIAGNEGDKIIYKRNR